MGSSRGTLVQTTVRIVADDDAVSLHVKFTLFKAKNPHVKAKLFQLKTGTDIYSDENISA
jgi:hypothetical protein